jgi:phage shock protein A
MSCDEDTGWIDDAFDEYPIDLRKRAVRQLIAAHQEEYDELTGRAAEERVEQLERQVREALRSIDALRAANPDGVAVPALTETANNLVRENDALTSKIKSLERSNAKLRSDNAKLREMLADA